MISEKQLFIGDFNKVLFQEVENKPYKNKPSFGFWTSNYKEKIGSNWLKWYYVNMGVVIKRASIFNIKKDAKIYTINNREDAMELHIKYGFTFSFHYDRRLFNIPFRYKKITQSGEVQIIPFHSKLIDFVKVSMDYDAIHLTKKGRGDTHLPEINDVDLNGWDVESTLWFNLNNLERIKKIKLKRFYKSL
jgi:hypothetical protein